MAKRWRNDGACGDTGSHLTETAQRQTNQTRLASQRGLTCALRCEPRAYAGANSHRLTDRIKSSRIGSDQDRSRGKVKGPAGHTSVASISVLERMKLSRKVPDSARTLGKRLSPRRADREEARLHVLRPPFVSACCQRMIRDASRMRRASLAEPANIMQRTQPYMAVTLPQCRVARK